MLGIDVEKLEKLKTTENAIQSPSCSKDRNSGIQTLKYSKGTLRNLKTFKLTLSQRKKILLSRTPRNL